MKTPEPAESASAQNIGTLWTAIALLGALLLALAAILMIMSSSGSSNHKSELSVMAPSNAGLAVTSKA